MLKDRVELTATVDWRTSATEIARGTLKMRDMKLRDIKMRHQNARVENARNAKVWNTACCICLSIAEQECMSRHERAPDFAANCVLVNAGYVRSVSHRAT